MNRPSGFELLLLTLLPCWSGLAADTPRECIILSNHSTPGRVVGAWGKGSAAEVSKDGVLRLTLAGGLEPAGVYFLPGRTFDLSDPNEALYLAMDVKGAKGGESFSIALRDGSLSGGSDGYQTEANLPEGFQVTTQWQRLVMPLSDFPATGENWSQPAPAGAQGPLRRKVDWSRISMLGIGRWAGEMNLAFSNIVVTPHPDSDSARLAKPLRLPESVDLSTGEPLLLAASFSMPTRWRIRIFQGAVSKEFVGLSGSAWARWDGAADQGEFKPGACSVELSYGAGTHSIDARRFNLAFPHSPRVQVAQTGYAPGDMKQATVMGLRNKTAFQVVDANSGEPVLRATSGAPVEVPLAGEWAASLDFSSVRKPGTYYVEVDGTGRSYAFQVREAIYDELMRTTMKSYFYQRCGMDLTSEYAGLYARKACHANDAWLYQGSTNDLIIRGDHRSSTGGWHDAGDYGKKIVAAADALGYLLTACELFPEKVRALRLNLPGNPEIPDMLREIKFELDWMLTMQETSGGVQALITSQDFFLTGMPDQDPQPRFFTGVSSCATGDFAAIFAQAARIYRACDSAFADRCLAASRRAWTFLLQHPEIVPTGGYHDPAGIHGTGTYDDADDRDERFRAACELFVTTGDAPFEQYVREHYLELRPELFEPPGYQHSQGFGIFSLVLSGKGGPDLARVLRKALLDYARKARDAINQSPYGIAIERHPNWWNNSVALESSATLVVAARIASDESLLSAAQRQLQSVLGCNPTDRCYVTGLGARRVMDPWQPASVYDGMADPVPGFVLPGPNLVAWDLPMQHYQEIHHLPPLKNYLDDHRAASVNEVCLNFNGPFVLVAAAFAR